MPAGRKQARDFPGSEKNSTSRLRLRQSSVGCRIDFSVSVFPTRCRLIIVLAELAMRRQLHVLLVLLLGVFCVSDACAYFPIRVRPSAVVAQADLIVVGRLKEGSVEHVSVKAPLGKDGTVIDVRVSRATLIVTNVERGELAAMQVTIWFRGNAVPVVGGRFEWDSGDGFPVKVNCREQDEAAVHIYEINTGPYKMGDGDLRTDHVWFMSLGSHLPGLKPDAKAWCVDDAQFVVPLALKESYLAIPREEDDFPL